MDTYLLPVVCMDGLLTVEHGAEAPDVLLDPSVGRKAQRRIIRHLKAREEGER
jgi:hypothetical protein